MKYARIIDENGDFYFDPNTGAPLRIPATKFETSEQAKAFLSKLEKQNGISGLRYCCGHGSCKSEVHFRKEIPKVAGTKSRARPQTWVSSDVDDHKPGCPGPSEQDFDHLPHNGLTLSHAIATQGEQILFHLNIEFERSTKSEFGRATLPQTEDVKWRKANADNHSYFASSDPAQLTRCLTQITQ